MKREGRCQELLQETMVSWSRVAVVEVARHGHCECALSIEPQDVMTSGMRGGRGEVLFMSNWKNEASITKSPSSNFFSQ